jgi:hypothetical protein
MKYDMTIMSIDPKEDPDDNHQKYHRSVEATSPDEARRLVTKEFTEKKLPIYWIKFN